MINDLTSSGEENILILCQKFKVPLLGCGGPKIARHAGGRFVLWRHFSNIARYPEATHFVEEPD